MPPKKVIVPFKKIKQFRNSVSPFQWNSLKEFLRTGKNSRGLRIKTVRDFAKIGLEYKEAVNARKRKPYTAKFSPGEKKEIKRQIKDIINLLMPKKFPHHKTGMAKKLFRQFELIQREQVDIHLNGRSFDDFFFVGRMYLKALDRHNELKFVQRTKKEGREANNETTGYNQQIYSGKGNGRYKTILAKNWRSVKYFVTTPAHEVVHNIFLKDNGEYRAHLVDYYYSLKRKIMTEKYLKERVFYIKDKELNQARRKAIQLFNLGKEKGWKEADKRLRKEVKKGN